MLRELRERSRAWASAIGPELGDALLYGASALFAGLVGLFSTISLYRTWGQLAVGPYAVATLIVAVVAWRRRQRGSDRQATSRRLVGLRVLAFAIVVLGATLLPLALEISWRNDGSASSHVQPEVVVIEQAAARITKGLDPYHAAVAHDGQVTSANPGEPPYESFFPYLPLMAVFGLPSTTHVSPGLGDARIFFVLVTFGVGGLALALCRGPTEPRVRALQVLTVLPTAALPLATGGDDLPIVALLLLAMVLAQQRRPGWSGVVLGVVSAMKFTAWPLAALALFAARDAEGRRRPARMLAGMAVVAVPLTLPYLVRDPHTFWANVVLFPLGLAGIASPAASAMPGHLIVTAFPSLHRVLPIGVALVGGAFLVRHLVRHPPSNTSAVCTLTGWVLLVAILFAPATRVGYLLYPINFFVWGVLFRGTEEHETSDGALAGAAHEPGPGANIGPA
jgi:hypothetical protein